jgi:hypothetical protein
MPIRVLLDASTSLVRSALKATLGDCPDIELVEPKAASIASFVDVIVVQKPLFADLPPLQDSLRFHPGGNGDGDERGQSPRGRIS